VRRSQIQNLVGYVIAAGVAIYASRGVSSQQVVEAARQASLGIFAIASLGGFFCWFIGEAFLYKRLFSSFHGKTGTRELLPAMYAFYFLQIVNSYLASGALVLFLHLRKRVHWLMGGCTLMFQAYLDAMLLAVLTLCAIALVPTSPIRIGLNFAAGVVLVGILIASYWLLWGARLPIGHWLRWIYDTPSMVSFLLAKPAEYAALLAIRLLIVVGAGFALYGQFLSFHIAVPLMQTLAMTPFMVALGNSPLSPGGVGTTQLIMTLAFAHFASKNDLFALSVAITAFNLIARIPMGLAMGVPFTEESVEGKLGAEQGVL
jgi:uncharacterized membrane protein YbhN (UPF0104 family)